MTAATTAPQPAAAAETIAVLDPATGEEIGTIPAGDAAAADRAVRAARAAQSAWARRPAAERAELLKAAAARAREHAAELAELVARENGRPVDESRGGVDAGIGGIEQDAELRPPHPGRAPDGAGGGAGLMGPQPPGGPAAARPREHPPPGARGPAGARPGPR